MYVQDILNKQYPGYITESFAIPGYSNNELLSPYKSEFIVWFP